MRECRTKRVPIREEVMRSRVAALAFVLLFAGVAGSHAQEFPNRQIRVLVPFPAGGTVDTVARLVGQKASEAAGQPFIIDNRGGAAGNIGADAVAKSPPDGYTVLQTVNGLSLSPSLYKKLPFDPLKDFIPVVQITASPLLIVASAKTPINSMQEFVALAKRKPGSLNYGSTGIGIPLHLTMEMLRMAAGVDLVHIPYKGDAPLLTALIAGDVQIACVPFATALPHIEAGTLRAIAVTTPERVGVLANVPTVAESGFPGFSSSSWQGWFVPAGTPRDAVMKLNGYARKAIASPVPALGIMGVDFEERVDYRRLHRYRLARAKQALENSELRRAAALRRQQYPLRDIHQDRRMGARQAFALRAADGHGRADPVGFRLSRRPSQALFAWLVPENCRAGLVGTARHRAALLRPDEKSRRGDRVLLREAGVATCLSASTLSNRR
jgi:tripartite-type tricarboxylate transporter receptor subunit TctC